MSWQDDAACSGMDPRIFFPPRGENGTEAKAVCATCTVRDECLEYALDEVEKFGIWGGLAEMERRPLRVQRRNMYRRLGSVQGCGTVAGYRRHRRAGEKACPACLAANAQKRAEWVRRQQGAA